MAHPYWIPIDASFIVTSEKQEEEGGGEVGQHSDQGPEATCMHPQDNNTPPVSYHRRLYTAELMEGLALMKEHKGLDDLSALDLATKTATYKPWSSWERSAQQGLFLKTRAQGRGRKRETESKQTNVRLT